MAQAALRIFLILLLPWPTLCAPTRKSQSTMGLKLPFSNNLDIPKHAGKKLNPGAKTDKLVQLNLPFSKMALPLQRFLSPLLRSVQKRPLIGLNYGKNKSVYTGGLDRAAGTSSSQASASPVKPWSVINMPFSSFDLPLSQVSSKRRLEFPKEIQYKMQALRSREALSLQNVLRKAANGRNPASAINPSSLIGAISRSASPLEDHGLSERVPVVRSLHEPLKVKVISEAALRGNMDTMLLQKGPRKGSQEIPWPNQLGLPLSVIDSPLSLIDLPLSKLLLPFSHFNPLAAARPSFRNSTPSFGLGRINGSVGLSDRADVHGVECDESDLVCQATAAFAADSGNLSLTALSLPYSFLNTPLSFFNLPLSFVNLPYGSVNLPISHLNLPFSFQNIPFAELLQTFGLPPPALARSSDGRRAEIVTSDRFRRSPLDDQDEPDSAKADQKLNMELKGHSLRNGSSLLAQSEPILINMTETLGGTSKVQEWMKQFLLAANSSTEQGNRAVGTDLSNGTNVLRFTDNLVAQFIRKQRSGELLKDSSKLLGDVMRQAGVVEAVPDLFGLIGTEDALFSTPFSLANLPVAFLDEPLGFLNLPLSHFSLPLSHLTLPFGEFELPLDHLGLPKSQQDVHSQTVQLADVTPSLLEALNPDDPLRSFLNLPLSEMNLPIAVLDMPFTVFDLPFAFMNTPFSHLNSPFTHLHLPFEVGALPFAETAFPFQSIFNRKTKT